MSATPSASGTHARAAIEIPPNGRVVRGPSAFSQGFRRFAALTWTLAVQEFKLRFFGSVLGYLWQLMRPLLLFGVLFVVFTEVVRVGNSVPHYPVLLLTNIVLFTALSEATSGSVTAVLDRENLVRKIQFPRMVIPLAVVLTALFNLCLNLCVVAVFALANGVGPRWSWLLLPAWLACLVILASGAAMLLSALFVRYRDVKPIWEVLLQILFYASPILYPIESMAHKHPQLAHLIMCSPFAALLEAVRHTIIDPTAPSVAQAVGAGWRVAIPLIAGIALFAVGLHIFNREAPRIAEDL